MILCVNRLHCLLQMDFSIYCTFRFPPALMQISADIFNRSSKAVEYLISFKRPRLIINRYRFNVELVSHLPTSMHASGEGHQCYIFRRLCVGRTRRCSYQAGHRGEGDDNLKKVGGIACDPLFYKAFSLCQLGRDSMSNYISKEVERFYKTKPKRSRKQVKRFSPGNEGKPRHGNSIKQRRKRRRRSK